MPFVEPRPPGASKLPIVALALAGAAVVLLAIAVLRRHAAGSGAGDIAAGSGSQILAGSAGSATVDPWGAAPANQAGNDGLASMFGAVCRHLVTCGVGDLGRCDFIETTMRQMPPSLQLRPCRTFDPAEAKRCLSEVAAAACDDKVKSLDVPALAIVLDRIASCRRACN